MRGLIGAVLILLVIGGSANVRAAAPDWNALVQQALPPLAKSQSSSPTLSLVQPQTVSAPVPTPGRELSPALQIAHQHWNELSIDTRARVQAWSTRPTDQCSAGDNTDSCYGFEAHWRYDPRLSRRYHDSAHYRIHYVVNETADYSLDMNTATAEFAATVAEVLEQVHASLHQGLAYQTPPNDGHRGGDQRFDVYLTELRRYGLYGYTVAEGSDGTPQHPFGGYSYMVLDNNYLYYGSSGYLPPLQVTAAHEYFHAVQNGYSIYEDPAFMEQSATWMEDMVFPHIHDNYAYIGEPFLDVNGDGQYSEDPNGDGFSDDQEPVLVDHNGNQRRDDGSQDWPELSLDSYNDVPLVQYGRFIWVRYLHERFGADLVRDIWERAGSSLRGTWQNIDQALREKGTSLAAATHEYALWAYDKDRFSDGYNYPLVWVDRTISGASVYLKSTQSPSLDRLRRSGYEPQLHLSSVYAQIFQPSGVYHFQASDAGVSLSMLLDYGDGRLVEEPVSSGKKAARWQVPEGVQRLVLVVTNTDMSRDGLRWSLLSGDQIRRDSKWSDMYPSAAAVSPLTLLLLTSGLLALARTRRRYIL